MQLYAVDMPQASEPDTSGPSIRVLEVGGRLQWDMPNDPKSPTRVPLVVDDVRWRGYTFWLSYVAGELVGLQVHRTAEAKPLAAHLLQRVPLGALDRAARRCVQRFLEEWERYRPEALHALYPDPADWLDSVADTNTAREDDEKLARFCKRYLELGGREGWRETLAQEGNYAPSSVQTVIARARKRRFLTKVPRGQYGGQLTPKALRLLAPPKMQSAWERATEDQRGAAIVRDVRGEALEADLLAQLQAGKIDDKTYRARSLALGAALMGWAPREMYADDPALAEIECELGPMKVRLEEQP
jgi:hypothetical protein